MSVNPCSACPLESLHRNNSKLKDSYKAELDEAFLKKARIQAGRSALKNLWHEIVPSNDERSGSDHLVRLQKQYDRYNALMPRELEEAIEACEAPFVQVTPIHDGSGAEWHSRLCGALAARSNLAVGGHRVEASQTDI